MNEFTYDWYTDFLGHCQRNGNLTLVRDAETAPLPQIILRHDIDFDLEAAWNLSLVEEESGVRSTFFVLVSTHYYNAAAPKARELLKKLVERGFEVGLHFDPSVYPDALGTTIAAGFNSERAFLESIVGVDVKSVSVHNPTAHGLYPKFPGVINAYDSRWFDPGRYVSDSLRRWKRDPFALVSQATDLGRVQVLCHPIHFSHAQRSYQSAIAGITEAWSAEAKAYIYEKNETYRNECLAARATEGDLR